MDVRKLMRRGLNSDDEWQKEKQLVVGEWTRRMVAEE